MDPRVPQYGVSPAGGHVSSTHLLYTLHFLICVAVGVGVGEGVGVGVGTRSQCMNSSPNTNGGRTYDVGSGRVVGAGYDVGSGRRLGVGYGVGSGLGSGRG